MTTSIKKYQDISSRYIYGVTIFLITLLIISFNMLRVEFLFADETSVSRATVQVPTACSFTAELNDPHTTTISAGTYQDQIGTTIFTVFCNDNSGYSIYAVGYSNNEFGNNKLLANMGGASTYDIVTGVATSGVNSNWAMKLKTVSNNYRPTIVSDADGSFSDYHIVPATYTKVVDFASNTDAIEGSKIQSTYAVYISASQPAGTYTGRVKYTLVHPNSNIPNEFKDCTAGAVCYWPNAGNTVADVMADQTTDDDGNIISMGSFVTLRASNFRHLGYGFAGWNTKYDYSGSNYGPNETIIANDLSSMGLSLYAVWIKSVGYMQNWSGCGDFDVGDTTALTDSRDGQTYAVAKLADGNCWMIENLRLDNSAELTKFGTNNPNVPLTNIYDTNTTSNYLSATSSIDYDDTISPEGWCIVNSEVCNNQSRLRTDNITNSNLNVSSADDNIYSYGNYYNWYSATAGHGTYEFNEINTSVDGDICPVGWRLPSGSRIQDGVDNDYYLLTKSLMDGVEPNVGTVNTVFYYNKEVVNNSGLTATEALRSYPNNFLYSGRVYGSDLSYRGSIGFYVTASTNNYANTFIFRLNNENVHPGTRSDNKFNGRSVRCLIKP